MMRLKLPYASKSGATEVSTMDHLFVVIYLLILATWTMGSDKKMFVRAALKLGDVKLEHAVYFPLPGMVLCTYPSG